jgi:hypothetical protein
MRLPAAFARREKTRLVAAATIYREQPGWPQLQEISSVSFASSQDVLQ